MMVGIMSPNEQNPSPRFLRLEDVAEELATSRSQIYALLRSGELKGIQIGGRSQWRIERVKWRSTSRRGTAARPRPWPIYRPI
jgi:excisionase family DNA binding protein